MRTVGLIVIGFLLGVFVALFFVPETFFLHSTSSLSSRTDRYSVTRVIDGDTIDIAAPGGIVERVRFIGIDTPETVDPKKKVQCYGPEASAHMKALLEGKTVTLTSKPDEDHDSYGRLLRYVFLETEDIGALMIREGYAVSLCHSFPHPKCDAYDALQEQAMEERRGRWAVCP